MENAQLAKIRQQLNLTQEQMAELMGCSASGYKRFEQGLRPIPRYVSHLAVAISLIDKNGLLAAWQKLTNKS